MESPLIIDQTSPRHHPRDRRKPRSEAQQGLPQHSDEPSNSDFANIDEHVDLSTDDITALVTAMNIQIENADLIFEFNEELNGESDVIRLRETRTYEVIMSFNMDDVIRFSRKDFDQNDLYRTVSGILLSTLA
ncbi:MAG: hypothetical protein KTR32_05210 [Granulosicoccus sp.]|nr:hypothetical protein [Granulosicoccus sp.]